MASHDEGHPAGRRAAEEPVIASLRKLGIAEEAIERAVERGDPEGAIFDAILLPAIAERTVSAAEVEAAGGLSAADVAALVNAFGFPAPDPAAPLLSPQEAEVLLEAGRTQDIWPLDVRMRVARVMGRQLACIAQAQVQQFFAHFESELTAGTEDRLAAMRAVHSAFARLLPLSEHFLVGVHRRWLEHELAQAAVGHAESAAAGARLPGAVDVAIVFCDLKDFTAYADLEGDATAVEAIDSESRSARGHRARSECNWYQLRLGARRRSTDTGIRGADRGLPPGGLALRASRGRRNAPGGVMDDPVARCMLVVPKSRRPTEMSTTRRRSATKTHERIGQLGWEPTHHQPVSNYPTKYTFPKKAKDPMKQIMREYLPMQLEKDERVYGGFDAAVRANMGEKANQRWLEVLKPFVHTTTYLEGCAGRVMSMLLDTVPNDELRNGFHVQFVDELRHIGMQQSLARWYSKNAPNPAGWDMGAKYYSGSPLTRAGYNMATHSIVGDPVYCGMSMMTVLETAFTNIAFVALPDVGARNGDFTLPTVYSSAQSDEARHISNGYAMLMTLLQEDSNIPLIQQDLASSWWANHAFIDPFAGTLIEYFSVDRSDKESYLQKWDRWVNDDYYKSYIEQLGKLGLGMDAGPFMEARQRLVNGLIHRTAIFAFAIWPLAYWRFDGLNENDFEWFEARYPGWYDEYGMLWEGFNALKDPREGALFLNGFLENASPICWSCMMQCLGDHDQLYRVVDDRTRFYCSEMCMRNDFEYPGRYTGDRHFFDRYHGWDLADVVQDIGFVREDGKTLVGQPHLDADTPMWTLADLKACGCEVKSPNIRTAEEMGLPNGSWHDASKPDGAVVGSEISYVHRAGSIGGTGLETGAAMRKDGNGHGRRNVSEVIR